MEEIKRNSYFVGQCLRIASEQFEKDAKLIPEGQTFKGLREQFEAQAKEAKRLARIVEDLDGQ